jgi:hypothetical protein
MPVRAVVTGVILIIMVSMLAFMVELFIPLSKKADIDMVCRSALLRMESAGGLDEYERQALQSELLESGFNNVQITASSNAKQGEMLTLHVEADYIYNKMTSLFKRENVTQRMVYRKSSMSRKVVN